AEPAHDLLLRGGRVIDPGNRFSAVADVAIRDGKIAAVASSIDPATAFKSVDVSGLYVTPGLIDIHVHVFAGPGERDSFVGGQSVMPDGFTFRSGVTTVADAGCSGWRDFEEFKERIVDRARTRVFAFLNIVGRGMRGRRFERDLDDMEPGPTAEMAIRHRDVIVGIKTAHYMGREFTAVERAIEAGERAGLPVMVDFGRAYPEKSLAELLTRKLRPGDIYTHVYSGLRGEIDPEGRANPALAQGRARGVLFDVGHGGGSFAWRVAVPIVQAGFLPDSISTDLHAGSANAGMKDMLNVMSKFLAIGVPLEEVILRATRNPAREIGREHLGTLSVGGPADVAVLKLEQGDFGFIDSYGARLRGDRRLVCEMTVRDGKIVYELNGLSRPDWTTLPKNYRYASDPRWDGTLPPDRNRIFEEPPPPPPRPAPRPRDGGETIPIGFRVGGSR
ncbi:MAG: amidohydrolase/deacetylase family metallohydrolase, partial [Isosphaeraceae bacterium]